MFGLSAHRAVETRGGSLDPEPALYCRCALLIAAFTASLGAQSCDIVDGSECICDEVRSFRSSDHDC